MIYNYNTYEFDIVFNSDDFVVRVIDNENEKIYCDVFLFENIKDNNNFYKTNNITEKFIVSCLNKKTNFNLEIKLNKNILITNFIFENELTNIELTLNVIPVRKDICINNEIIELKRKVAKLELLTNKFDFNNFLFDNNLIHPINLSYTDTICFSTENAPYIKLIAIMSIQNQIQNIVNMEIQSHQHYSFSNYYNTKMYNKGCINYNISKVNFNERFRLLKNKEIIFYNINFTNNIINNLSNNVNIIKLCNCKCNISIVDNRLNINTIYLFKCTITSLSGLYKQEKNIKIINYTNANSLAESFNVKIEKENECNELMVLS